MFQAGMFLFVRSDTSVFLL